VIYNNFLLPYQRIYQKAGKFFSFFTITTVMSFFFLSTGGTSKIYQALLSEPPCFLAKLPPAFEPSLSVPELPLLFPWYC